MKIFKFFLIRVLVFASFQGFTAFAQNNTRLISGDFRNLSVEQFAQDLEKQTGFHFYYDAAQFDSAKVNLQVTNKTLNEVLEEAFQNTIYRYSIDEKQHVFLSTGRVIRTDLPVSLFQDSVILTSQPVKDFLTDLTDKNDESARAILENKLYAIGLKTNDPKTGNINIAGYVRNIKTGEMLSGVKIFTVQPSVTVMTNQSGYYSISLPAGRHILNISAVGMRDALRQVMLYSEGKLNIELYESVQTLKDVIITSESAASLKNVQMGIEKLSIQSIKQVPTVFGETDLIKVILTLPGVKSTGEASTGFNVRGGATDQNLILFNDATIYNPSHFFGFFSAFNAEVVKEAELYKSSIPVKYGGRLASVLDIKAKEGNSKEFAGVAGIGLLTSRLTLEGPTVKDKGSFVLGGRTTYSNWILNLLPNNASYKGSKVQFSDINLNLNHRLNDKNSLSLMGYLSHDQSNLNTDTVFAYDNRSASFKWKHEFNSKFTGILTAGSDNYKYNNFSDKDSLLAYEMKFDLKQLNFKTDFQYFLNSSHTIDFGLSSIHYKLHPGDLQPKTIGSITTPTTVEAEQALESAIYVGDKYDISPDLSVSFGLRFSLFNYLGPKNVYSYTPNLPIIEDNKADSIFYKPGSTIKNYFGPEYRLSARYTINDNLSVKAGYNTLRQYIHMLSNTTAIAPTDIWKLSDSHIRPQQGDQLSLGLYKNFKANTIETSVEIYYKRIRNYLDYKSGAKLLLNQHIETDVISTQGKAYGAEFLVKKLYGKLNGWASYTYSRTLLRMNDPGTGEQLINRGEFYPANYDKPHDFTLIGNYRLSHRVSSSLNVTYSTGRPVTIPIGQFRYGGFARALYSDRNSYRIPDYFRSDVAINIEGNHKLKQFTHSSWTIGFYNLTGRKNAYSVYFVSEHGAISQTGVISSYKLSIFGTIVPFVNYNVRF